MEWAKASLMAGLKQEAKMEGKAVEAHQPISSSSASLPSCWGEVVCVRSSGRFTCQHPAGLKVAGGRRGMATQYQIIIVLLITNE